MNNSNERQSPKSNLHTEIRFPEVVKLPKEIDKNAKKILVVDDERSLSKVMKLKLNAEGFKVDIASNGQEALTCIFENNYNLVLLDLVMPDINGFEVLEKLKKNNNKTPVIVTSNLSQNEDIIKAKSLGAVDFYIKSSVPISNIVQNIKVFLNSSKV